MTPSSWPSSMMQVGEHGYGELAGSGLGFAVVELNAVSVRAWRLVQVRSVNLTFMLLCDHLSLSASAVQQSMHCTAQCVHYQHTHAMRTLPHCPCCALHLS